MVTQPGGPTQLVVPLSESQPRHRRTHTVLLIALAAVAAAVLSFRDIYEPDLWWHLAQGREAAAGRLVRSNVFNFLYPGYPQAYTPWLFDLGAYAAWQVAHGIGIQVVQAALLGLTLVILYMACLQRATPAAALAVLILGFFVLEPRAIPRPHLVSFAGIAACTLLIEHSRRARSAAPLWWAVPVVAVWSNLHAECIFGVLLIGLFACGETLHPSTLPRPQARRAIAISGVLVAATLANPYGWGLEQYLTENWRLPQLLNIAELRPAYLPNYRAFFVYLVVGAMLLLTQPRAAAVSEVSGAVVFALLGLKFLRFTPLVFLVTAPLLAERISGLMARGLDGRAVVITATALAIATARMPLSTLVHLSAGTSAVAPPAFFPPGFPAFARRTGLGGPVFNSMNLGGYLAWELYPEAQVFQDGRLQAVPPEHFRRILDASRTQADWDALLTGIDWAILSTPRPNELSGAGRFPRDRWATIYWDEAVEVFVRRSGRFDSLIEPYEYSVLLPSSVADMLVGRLASTEGARIRMEATRNLAENPGGSTAAAVLCADGNAAACARLKLHR